MLEFPKVEVAGSSPVPRSKIKFKLRTSVLHRGLYDVLAGLFWTNPGTNVADSPTQS